MTIDLGRQLALIETAQRTDQYPAPPGRLPAAALDGKALRSARTPAAGRVFLVGTTRRTEQRQASTAAPTQAAGRRQG
ncbi:hypothetical protein ABZY81_36590 [Streptomyces sp. NPDC006514]|uniref:hypothetical protein n=1 Tax=Streptomyces sp. NPDC006514 TaxID=3154308 RepID=UPI0033B8CAC2